METRIPLPLPGLDRLIEVCRKYNLPLKLSPPRAAAPQTGELFFSQPFDPQLAAVYQRLGDAELGDFYIERPGNEWNEIHGWNARVREYGSEPFRSCILFGGVPNLAYYYGTVPALAGAHGLQPVVEINSNAAELSAIPLASSVDRFFDIYSRYLERMAVDVDYVQSGVAGIHFPGDVPELVAADEPLMALVTAGRFDFLTNGYRGAREWLRQIAEVHRG